MLKYTKKLGLNIKTMDETTKKNEVITYLSKICKNKVMPLLTKLQNFFVFYKDLIEPCLKYGIKKIHNTGLSANVFREKLMDKKEIYLIGTTLAGLIRINKDILTEAIVRGANVYVLIANKNSIFCHDVAAIEALSYSKENVKEGEKSLEGNVREEEKRLESEFESVKSTLKLIIKGVKQKRASNDSCGHLFFGNAFTLVRQTIIVGINDEENTLWAWLSITMPPKRAAHNTLGIEVETLADDGDEKHYSFAETIKEHVKGICNFARINESLFEINDETTLPKIFPLRRHLRKCRYRIY